MFWKLQSVCFGNFRLYVLENSICKFLKLQSLSFRNDNLYMF